MPNSISQRARWYPTIWAMSDVGKRTLYQLLQLDPLAEPEIVAVVYRRLAQRYHPDHNASAAAAVRMREINAAYAILRDPEKRTEYDAELRAGSCSAAAVVVTPDPAERRGGIDFGRYRGYSIEEVARVDPDFLDWLERTPNGWHLRPEIKRVREHLGPALPRPHGGRATAPALH